MTEFKMETKKRDLSTAPKTIRKSGKLPGILYGRREDSIPVSIDLKKFEKVWNEVGGASIITLTGLDRDRDVLIYSVQEHPLTGQSIHVDFYAIEKGKKLTATVPLEFLGIAPAVKEKGGNLLKILHEIEVESLPKDLPSSIEVDVSSLDNFEKQIQIKDLNMPTGVEPMAEMEDVVVLVSESEEESEEEVASEEPDFSQIEVEKKGKDEPEEETKSSE